MIVSLSWVQEKLEEIKAIDGDEISTVIVNNRLTPRQNTTFEAAFGASY